MTTTPRNTNEWLAVPAWNAPPRGLADWVAQLTALGLTVAVARESSSAAWLEIVSLPARGYALGGSDRLEAINFELSGPDPERAVPVLKQAAEALGWELHPDDDEAEDQDHEM